MENSLKTVAETLNIILRYLASGMVFVLIWIMLCDDKTKIMKMLADNETLSLIGAAVIGILIYSIHKAVLDRVFYKSSILKYIRKNGIPEFVKTPHKLNDSHFEIIKGKITLDKKLECRTTHKHEHGADAIKSDLSKVKHEQTGEKYCDYYFRKHVLNLCVFELYTQTFLRSASSDVKVKVLVEKMEDRYAILAFLYCISYTFLLSAIAHFLIFRGPEIISKICIQLKDVAPYISYVAFGFFFLAVAQIYSYRLLRREVWIVENYKQELH